MAEMDTFERSLAGALLHLADDVAGVVDAAAVAHRVALEHPRPRARALTWGPVAIPRLAWVLLIAALLAALAAGLLVVGSSLHDPSALSPSGIEVMSPDAGSYNRVVADGDGNLWAADAGRLDRYTPASGTARTWTVSDDLRFGISEFGISDITPARAGGVWLIGDRSLRRFDGAGFRETVDVRAAITAAVEAPDLSLWAATTDGNIVHVHDATTDRISVSPLYAPSHISSIAVDDAGRVWCGWTFETETGINSTGWVSRYDGSGWVTFDDKAAAPLGGSVLSITALPDGSIVATTSRGIARFSGDSWTDLTATALAPAAASSAAMAPDGSLWTAGADPTDGTVTVGHLAGGSWTLFGPAEGLPGAGPVTIPLSTVVTNDGVFVGTGTGLYRLADGRWNRVWPRTSQPAPDFLGAVAAASRDEAWAWDLESFWHFANGSWTAAQQPGSSRVGNLLRAADGTLWATVWGTGGCAGGAFVLQEGRWVQVASAPAALGANATGSVWVAGPDGASPAGIAVRSFAFDGHTWTARSSTASTELVTGCLRGLAIGGDGSVWMGSSGWRMYQTGNAGLARYRNGSWEFVRPPGASATFAILDLAAAPDGSVWVLGYDPAVPGVASGASTPEARTWVARFDGAAWRVFDAGDGLPPVNAIAVAPEGTIWAATSDGLARFDGTTWTTVGRGLTFYDVDVAPDGTVWVTGSFGVARLAPSLTAR